MGIKAYDDIIHLVIWPEGTSINTEMPLSISTNGNVINSGEYLEGAGGFYHDIDGMTETIDRCQAPEEVIRIRFE